MVIGALHGTVFHTLKCPFIKKIKPSSALYFDNKDQARNCGFKHCKCCSLTFKYYEQDKTEIDKFASTHGMTFYMYDDAMFIEHGTAAWKITTESNGPKLVLWHANTESYVNLEKRGNHIIHHYHFQRYRGDLDILSMMQYIVDHDEWRSKNDLESYKSLPTGSKKQKKSYKKAKEKARRKELKNVYNLIEKISLESKSGE